MFLKRCLASLLGMIVILQPGLADAKSAADLLTQRLSTFHRLQAEYQQTTFDPAFGKEQVVSGNVIMERPDQFRWEIAHPYKQVLLSDGQRFFVYDEDLKQLLIKPLSGSITDAPALLLIGKTGDVTSHFNVTQDESMPWSDTFTLTPKDKDSLIRAIQLIFRGSAIEVLRIHDTLDQVLEIKFSRIHLNEAVTPEVFTLTPPTGTDIIEEK